MLPLGKENATGKGGALRLTSNDTAKVVQSAAGSKPPILAKLEAQGSKEYTHRHESGEIRATCPLCGGKLIISDSEPWLICFGPASCGAHRAPFMSILVRMR